MVWFKMICCCNGKWFYWCDKLDNNWPRRRSLLNGLQSSNRQIEPIYWNYRDWRKHNYNLNCRFLVYVPICSCCYCTVCAFLFNISVCKTAGNYRISSLHWDRTICIICRWPVIKTASGRNACVLHSQFHWICWNIEIDSFIRSVPMVNQFHKPLSAF